MLPTSSALPMHVIYCCAVDSTGGLFLLSIIQPDLSTHADTAIGSAEQQRCTSAAAPPHTGDDSEARNTCFCWSAADDDEFYC